MPRFPRNNEGPFGRRPKPRPAGFSPQRFGDSGGNFSGGNRSHGGYGGGHGGHGGHGGYGRPRPPQQRPQPKPRVRGPARKEPLKPTSGKMRRRMVKAAAWRLAQLIHVRPAEVMSALATQPRLDVAFPNRSAGDRWSEARRLAQKIYRLRLVKQ